MSNQQRSKKLPRKRRSEAWIDRHLKMAGGCICRIAVVTVNARKRDRVQIVTTICGRVVAMPAYDDRTMDPITCLACLAA